MIVTVTGLQIANSKFENNKVFCALRLNGEWYVRLYVYNLYMYILYSEHVRHESS